MQTNDSSKENKQSRWKIWEWLIEEWKYLAKLYEAQKKQLTNIYYPRE